MIRPGSRGLLWAAGVSAVAAMLAEASGQRALYLLLKPLTTTLIILWAWPRGADHRLRQRALRAGLLLSLAGDIFLMWPQQGFLPGLVSFLLAHLGYLVMFGAARPRPGWRELTPTVLLYAAVAGAVLNHLWPGVPAALQAPVLAYVGALGAMAALSAAVWRAARDQPSAALARSGAIGGLLFLCSDAILATNRFAGPVPLAGVLILSTYWVAQAAIAASLAAAASPMPDRSVGAAPPR